jgi:hypothetical protein
MTSKLHRLVWTATILGAGAMAPAVRAQAPARPGPVPVPTVTNLGVTPAATAPTSGSVSLRSYSTVSDGRNEFGVPVVGRVPYVSRGFRNVGYGRSAVSVRASVSVRVIDLREEEFRQTGLRSR